MANCISTFIVLAFILNISSELIVNGSTLPIQPTLIDRDTCDECDNKLNTRPSYKQYLLDRQKLITDELKFGFGQDVVLNERETLANKKIMKFKEKELIDGLISPSNFTPAHHIFEVLNEFENSELFKIIRRMPKGGILHAHDTALVSADYLVSLTYRDHLWQCDVDEKSVKFRFSQDQPSPLTNAKCNWSIVKDERTRVGAKQYDALIRTKFTLFDKNVNPRIQFKDINHVWSRFMTLFRNVGGLVTYAPVWKDYYKRALEEMKADGVQYLEFRGTLPQVSVVLPLHFILLSVMLL